jgi:16S rRNA (guanine1207-N2)-methyltransferase
MSGEALKTLFHPFESGAITAPGADARILFINGRICAGLSSLPRARVTAQQYSKPLAAALEQAGYDVANEIPDGPFDVVLIAGTRQHQEMQYSMAAGLRALEADGIFACASGNDEGGRRLKKDAVALGLSCMEDSKHKARAVWGIKGKIDEGRVAAWIAAGGYNEIPATGFVSRPGVFSWDEIDPGSALLAAQIPNGALNGRGADFGCGYGFLSRHVVQSNHGITEIFCIDADARAVEACRRNVPGGRHIWADIAPGNAALPSGLDWIVMNPPFHSGRDAAPETGISFIHAAQAALKPGGVLWMVANAHLPYEKTLDELFGASEKICEDHGYKVYRARRDA